MVTRRRILSTLVLVGLVYAGGVSCGHKPPTQPTPSCSYAVSPGSLNFGAEGGAGSVTVTAPQGCAWSATASASWISMTAGNTGSGTGTLSYAVAVNPAADTRTATLAVGGQTHAVTQQGRAPEPCSYELSPSSAEFGADGGTGTFSINARADCTWTATSNAAWLTVTSGTQGSGNGAVSYAIARYGEPTSRTALIGVADKTFTVRQSGDLSVCQYSVAPIAFTPCMPGSSVASTVTTQAGCPWTAASNAAWLGISSGSGSGSGTITITFTDNYEPPREGIVMVRWPTPTAGQNIRVSQAGCFYAVSRNTFSFTSTGGTGSFDVLQQSEPNTCGGATQDRCVWTARSDASWITITTSMPRAGDNPVSFTVAANDSPTSRVGTIQVQDKVVVITQAGR